MRREAASKALQGVEVCPRGKPQTATTRMGEGEGEEEREDRWERGEGDVVGIDADGVEGVGVGLCAEDFDVMGSGIGFEEGVVHVGGQGGGGGGRGRREGGGRRGVEMGKGGVDAMFDVLPIGLTRECGDEDLNAVLDQAIPLCRVGRH